jgi:hypothetical protein
MAKAMFGTWTLLFCFAAAWAQDQPQMTCAEIEQFLRTAKIGQGQETKKGITRPKKVILDDGKFKHAAVTQCIDERKTQFQSLQGTELNFRDFWGYNVAGYELAKMLELRMIPPYVARKAFGQSCSLSWLIPDVMMDEVDRMNKHLEPPDRERWNHEMYVLRIFNELIYNTDNNLTNVLITKDWHIWMIDFTRSFRLHKTLKTPENLVQCDRTLLANLHRLNGQELESRLVKVSPRLLTGEELGALMARRDKIVEFFDNEVKRKGEAAVLFDLPRIGKACGAGL